MIGQKRKQMNNLKPVKTDLHEDRNGLWWVEIVYSNGFIEKLPEPFDSAAEANLAVVHLGQHE